MAEPGKTAASPAVGPLRILVLASEVPATANMPGSPRLFSLCRYLSERHQLTLVAFEQGAERTATFRADPMVQGVFERIEIIPPPPEPGWLGRQHHRLRQEANIITRLRTPVYHRRQVEYIRRLAVDGGFDVILADCLPVSQYLLRGSVPVPAVIDIHDCLSLLFDRTTRMQNNWLKRLRMRAETWSMARLERGLSERFSCIITNSEVDQRAFQALDPRANTLTIGNGVDSEFFGPGGEQGVLSDLVFTGVMNYGPNEDAAEFFVREVLPGIEQQHPEVRFWCVGKDPSDRVRSLADRPSVVVTGGVPDVRPYLERSGIFVCPLRYGTGVKNKLLAALAMGKAVVCTSLSLDGMDFRDEIDLLVADTPEQFAAQVIRLIEDPGLANRLGTHGQRSVRERYSWETSGQILESVLVSAAAGRNQK